MAFLGERGEGTQPFPYGGELVPIIPRGVELRRRLGGELLEGRLALAAGLEVPFDDAPAGLQCRFIRNILCQRGLQLDEVVGQEA